MRRTAEVLTDGLTDPAEKMKAIYDYVRTTVSWNGARGYGLDHDLDDVLEAKTGSSPEIALLLVSMLRDVGLKAHPVLISTRDHGRAIEVYPFLQQFNDVLVHADLGEERPRLLSTTGRLRPSTLLPSEALNHRGLLLAGGGPAWIDMTAGENAYRRKAYVQAALDASGAVSGTVRRYDDAYSALDARAVLADEAPADFVREHLLHGLSGAQVTAQTIAHQDDVNKPLEVTATVQVPGYAQVAGDFIYVNPMLIEQRTENLLRRPAAGRRAGGAGDGGGRAHTPRRRRASLPLPPAADALRERSARPRRVAALPGAPRARARLRRLQGARQLHEGFAPGCRPYVLPGAHPARPRSAAATGQRLFAPLNPVERWAHTLPAPQPERTQPVQFFGYPFADTDTVTYVLPEGFVVEAAPGPVVQETAFGRYESKTEVQPDGTLVHVRHVEVTEPTLPPGQYGAFRAFMQRAGQADRAQFVLVQKEKAAPTPSAPK